ncbi:GNAT family N-acetyltransferase [Peredibacter sp. HCB2-198]|uniref:GNAT family N-acetyltransferase n=1 Tax=Peredibacter sp. HCB2-198 TaxID=3383025 RepID=UPI0038B570F6
MNIKIRPGLLFDIQTIADYQVKMAFETENGLKLDPPTVEKGVTAVMDDPSKGKYWLAEVDGQVVGCLLTVPEWSDWRNGNVLWIHSVYVHPDFRKYGVYKALYSHLKTMVQESPDLRGLRLYVDKTNMKAQDVYKKLGMTDEHYHLYEWMKG